jgi:hypothetical protein
MTTLWVSPAAAVELRAERKLRDMRDGYAATLHFDPDWQGWVEISLTERQLVLLRDTAEALLAHYRRATAQEPAP